jgi:hypothetical protein
MTQTFSCPACGAPNEPIAGQIRMSCAYCRANLTIPDHLRTMPNVTAEEMRPTHRAVPSPEIDAADLLRKAQPVAIGAWNLFAMWTWLRRLIPACLTIFIIGIILCALLGALPFIFNVFR